MRRIKKSLAMGFSFLAASALISSCDNAQEVAPKAEISSETLAKFSVLGYKASDVQINNTINPLTGEKMGDYVLQNDIHIKESQLDEMVATQKENILPSGEQYITNALVSPSNYNISITGLQGYGGGFDLTSRMRTALSWAVANYNRLNIGLNFSLNYASSWTDMVVYNNGQSGGGGSAGFPQNGQPFTFVQINAGTDAFGTNVVEHVMTHEIGHSVGFRHTDYFNRSLSCGTGGNEGSAGVGANYVPGTPSGTDTNSIMQACFSAGEDGEFGQFDIVALEFMY